MIETETATASPATACHSDAAPGETMDEIIERRVAERIVQMQAREAEAAEEQAREAERVAALARRAALDAEIARRIARDAEKKAAWEEDHRNEIAAEAAARALIPHTTREEGKPLGQVLDAVCTAFAGIDRKLADHRAAMQPQVEAVPPMPCPRHPGMTLALDSEATLSQSWLDRVFTPIYTPCPACADEAKRAKRAAYWTRRGVPWGLAEASFATFDPYIDPLLLALRTVKDYAAKARPVEHGPGDMLRRSGGGFCLIVGTKGVGKTHLAVAAMAEMDCDGLFVGHADLLSDLRASYSTGGAAAYVEKMKNAPVLIIDQYGLRSSGKDEEPLLYQVLASRYESRRPTIITGTLTLSQLRDSLGERLVDRIRECCTAVVMTGESYRARRAAQRQLTA